MNEAESSGSQPSLPVGGGDPPVPAYGCVVYVSQRAARFHGRVANLPAIEADAANQRELLGKIVAQFKTAVSECVAAGEEPKWIDPPLEKSESEQKLFLPVHL